MEVAAELEEFTKSEVCVDELAYAAEKGAPIQQVREFIMSLTHLHHADFDMRYRKKSTKRWPLRLMMICKRGPAVRRLARLNVVRSLLDEDETFLEITTLKFKFMFQLQEVVLEQGELGRHMSGSTIFDMFSFGHRVCLELACKSNRFEVFHLFAPRHFCKSMVRPGCQSCVGCYFKNIEALCVHVSCCCSTPRLSSIRAGDQSLMRVLLRFGRDHGEPPLVLVGIVVSRFYMSSGGLAVGVAGKDCSPTWCAVAKGMCPFLLWLQAALWAEVSPADTQRIEGVERPSCQRGKIRTPYALAADVCTLDRQTFHHHSLPRQHQVQRDATTTR